MKDQLSAPVLLVAFNRPDTTQIVFDKIREARPLKLYIAVDGPRPRKEGEDILVEQVKAIVTNVVWPCETHYRFSKENYGAEVTVSSAISWALEKEEYVIILEDDIIAPIAFFRFAQEMLVMYKDNEQIGIVSGCNYTPLDNQEADYFFAKYAHSWGWATWKRVWDKFDLNVEVKDEHLRRKFLKSISNSKEEMKHYQRKFLGIKRNGPGKSTWDNVGGYIMRINYYLNIVPRVNLTSNIGVYGLHAKGQTDHHFRQYDESFVVNKHPETIELNIEYDKHHFQEQFLKHKKTILQRLINKISRILTGSNYFK
jgi:hypothetical protein